MKYLKLISFLLLPYLAGTEPTTQDYTLPSLIKQMEEKNLLLKISRYDHQIRESEYRISRALPNPEFEYSRGKMEVNETGERLNLWGLGLSLNIPNPIYRHYLLKSQRSETEGAKIRIEIHRRELIQNLKSHFYTLQFFQKLHGLVKNHLENLQEVGKITRAKAKIGEVKEIDALRAAVEIQKQQTELFKTEKTIASKKTNLNEMLNFTLPGSFRISEDFHYRTLPPIETRLKQIIEKSPLVTIKSTHLKSEKNMVKAQQYSLVESISLFGEHGQEPEGKVWKMGIGVEIPIFSTRGRFVKQAKLKRERAKIELHHVRQHLLTALQRLVAEIRIVEKEISTYKGAILHESKLNLDLTEKLYRQGEVPLIVYLDSQNSFLDIQTGFFKALTEWNLLKAQLEALLGGEI